MIVVPGAPRPRLATHPAYGAPQQDVLIHAKVKRGPLPGGPLSALVVACRMALVDR
jgi:hypothetical protein